MATIKKLARLIRKFLHSPLLLLFFLTSEKEMICSDVKRWDKEYSHQDPDYYPDHLLGLLAEFKEFRSLYYYRLFQDNAFIVLLTVAMRVVYKEMPVLFLKKSCTIGKGLFIQHGFSTGVEADIGDNCWINQQVTIGYNDGSGQRPKLGNNVRICTGAKVFGGITIGDNSTIGANTVVVRDVPPNCVVVGLPAYIIRRDGERVFEKL